MEDNNQFNDYTVISSETGTRPLAKTFMANVFLWMFAALAISALFAFLFSTSPALLSYLIKADGTGLNMLGWVVMFAPLGFVLLMSLVIKSCRLPLWQVCLYSIQQLLVSLLALYYWLTHQVR